MKEFNEHLTKQIRSKEPLNAEKTLNKLRCLNTELKYELSESQMFELCEHVMKEITDHEKLVRTKFFKNKRKNDIHFYNRGPSNDDEELKKKLKENAVEAKKNMKIAEANLLKKMLQK